MVNVKNKKKEGVGGETNIDTGLTRLLLGKFEF